MQVIKGNKKKLQNDIAIISDINTKVTLGLLSLRCSIV